MSAGKSTEKFQLTQQTEVVTDYESPSLHSKLQSIFYSIVFNATSKIKFPPSSKTPIAKNTSKQALEDVPKTIGESKELDSNVVIPCPVADNNVATMDLAPHKKHKRRTSIVVDEQSITFELPKPCFVDKIDMDKLPLVDQEGNPMLVPVRKLSYRERLKGWIVELTEREKTQIHEKFYHHPQSSRAYRSCNEVVNFILYEDYRGRSKYTEKAKKMELIEDMGNDMTTEAQRMKSLCMPTSGVDHRSVQEISRDVVEKIHKIDSPNIVENDIELQSQRSMPMQLENIYQGHSEAYTWQKKMFADYQSLFYKSIAAAKLPPGVLVTDNAFIQAQALEAVPISIYIPDERVKILSSIGEGSSSKTKRKTKMVVHSTSKMTTSVMVEDKLIKNMPVNSNEDMGEKGKARMTLEEFKNDCYNNMMNLDS